MVISGTPLVFKMEDEELVAFSSFLLVSSAYLKMKKKKRNRRWWVHPVLQDRNLCGYSTTLLPRMQQDDADLYRNFLRVSPEAFNKLLHWLCPIIAKQVTRFREPISAETRLQITLRSLATGEKFNSLNLQFRVGRTTVGKIVQETCKAIWAKLAPIYVNFPKTENHWQKIADDFQLKWQLPHCLGAIDGKHVRMQKPFNTGSLNFNYKHYFSKVLFAVAAANYKFIYVDVENYGSEGDSGILHKSTFGKLLQSEKLNLPKPARVGRYEKIPYFFIGDQAFPLRTDLMRPHKGKILTQTQKIFNYRLCRARRVVENAFGIMSNRFRIFKSELQASEVTNDLMVLASIALHNYLIEENCQLYCPPSLIDREDTANFNQPIDGTWREEVSDRCLGAHGRLGTANYSRLANDTRNQLGEFFTSPEGSVAWQDTSVSRGYYS